MKISITNKHISGGVRQNNEYCPISLAIKELTRCTAFTGRNGTRVESEYASIYFNLPEEARTFIAKFDRLGARYVAPFTCELELEEINENFRYITPFKRRKSRGLQI